MSFDSHAHLDLAAAGDSLQWKALLDRAFSAGIQCILVPSVHPDRWNNLFSRVCAAYQGGGKPRLVVAMGIHPWALKTLIDDEVTAALNKLDARVLAADRPPWLVALGESGLHFPDSPGSRSDSQYKARQLTVFRHHLRLSQRSGLPLTIHCVGAYGPLMAQLRACPPAPSIVHGFSGKPELAKQLCAMGHGIGIGGMITHPRAKHLKRAILEIPPEQLLLETDAPDQTPWTLQPRPNEPSFLGHIAQAAAEILKVSPETLLQRTAENAARYLNLPWPIP